MTTKKYDSDFDERGLLPSALDAVDKKLRAYPEISYERE